MEKIVIDGVAELAKKQHRLQVVILASLVVVAVVVGGIFFYRTYRSARPGKDTVTYDSNVGLPEVKPTSPNEPKSKDFGLVIDKISANAPIVKEVDPDRASVYYQALESGVAHWRGTPYPDQPGNLFIFGHSSFYAVAKGDYKDIFSPLDKVEKGDQFDIWYNNQPYTYEVVDNKVVRDDDFSVLDGPTPQDPADKTITIMTCWPPKTIAKRRVVFAKQV